MGATPAERAKEIVRDFIANLGILTTPSFDDTNRLIASIEAAIREARADEREACAGIAQATAAYDDALQKSAGCGTTGERIAFAIRTRKDDPT